MLTSFTDQLNNSVQISFSPKRIVSVVPSQTELLYTLGLEDEVVGITKFCIHPNHWFKTKKRIGGTKTINIQAVKEVQPDLIIANKEENEKEQIVALQSIAPVWISDIQMLTHALKMIKSVGELVNKTNEAVKMAFTIEREFEHLQGFKQKLRTAYLIWKDPYMVAGGDTFINDMMNCCGFDNVFANQKRYPAITIEQLVQSDCKLILLSSEPYPFKEKHIQQLQQQLPGSKIILVDGEMFSWYGSRLLQAPAYFAKLIDTL